MDSSSPSSLLIRMQHTMVTAFVIRNVNTFETLVSVPGIFILDFCKSLLTFGFFDCTLCLRCLFFEKPKLKQTDCAPDDNRCEDN